MGAGPDAQHDRLMMKNTSDRSQQSNRFERSREERIFAGVSGGLGEHFDLNPWLFRTAFIVLTVFGFAGILFYVAGWLLIPDADEDESIVASWLSGLDTHNPAAIGGVILIGLAIVVIISGMGMTPGRYPLAALLLVVGVLLYRGDLPLRGRGRPNGGEPRANGPVAATPGPGTGAPPSSEAPGAAGGRIANAGSTSQASTTPGSAVVEDTWSGVNHPRNEGESDESTRIEEADDDSDDDASDDLERDEGWPPDDDGPGSATAGPSALSAPELATGGTFGDPPPPAPAAESTSAPGLRPRRQRSALGRLTLAVSFISVGGLAAADAANWLYPDPVHYLALPLATLGGALVIGAVAGRARWLILIGVLLVPPVLIASVISEIEFSGEVGERRLTLETGDIDAKYSLAAGSLRIDLRDVVIGNGEEVAIDFDVGAGELIVIVPRSAGLQVDASVGIGTIELLGRERAGIGLSDKIDIDGDGTFVINAQTGFGTVEIIRR